MEKSWDITLSPVRRGGGGGGINICKKKNDWFWENWMCWTQLRHPRKLLPHPFWDMGYWLGAPPTPGDKLLSNKWLILAYLTLGTHPHHQKNVLLCRFWDTASDWECHLRRGINCCQINNWFWVMWTCRMHPRHFEKFLPCRFWDTAFDLECPLCLFFFCQKTTDFGWFEGAESIPALHSLYDIDKLGDNIIPRLKLGDNQIWPCLLIGDYSRTRNQGLVGHCIQKHLFYLIPFWQK